MKMSDGMASLAVWCAAVLLVTVWPVRGATWSGTGGDDNWSTAGNWGGTAPAPGDPLFFAGAARTTNTNDFPADTSFSGITFNTGSALFRLTGSRITLDGDVINNDDSMHRIEFDMVLPLTRSFILNSGDLHSAGVLSGPGGITTKGSSARTLVLSGSNSYQGETTVDVSHLRITGGEALGSAAGGTLVKNERRLELSGGIVVTGEVATINGGGGNYFGALQSVAGTNTWAGPVVLGSTGARLGSTAASAALKISGGIDDGPNAYHLVIRSKEDCGPVILSGTNTYGGETQVVVGTLKLDGGDNRLPAGTVVRVGNGSNVNWAKLDLNGWDQEVKGLAADGTTMSRAIGNSASVFSTLTVNNPGNYSFKGKLVERLNLEKKGGGTLTLESAASDFWGETAVRAGTLVLLDPMSIGSSTLNTGDGAGGTLSFANNTVINFGGLIGTNNLVLTNAVGQSVSLRIRGAQSTVFDGQIREGVDFIKSGTGTLTMMQANTFTGKAFLEEGTLYLPYEDSLGIYPATFVQDQITFKGGTLRANTNYLFAANNRGVTLAAGGAKFYMGSLNDIFTVEKRLTGSGGVTADGSGVVLMTVSNSYEGVTTLNSSVLRITDKFALGSTAGGTVVKNGGQLELADGVVVSHETLSLSGAGITAANRPPTSPMDNRGGLQAAVNATAEWAGPVLLVSDQPRAGAQNGGHLILSGVIDDGPSVQPLRISSDPSLKTRGVELRAQNTYNGVTDIIRGTLLLGISDAIPSGSVLDVHWAASNNGEYAGFDLMGFDQRIGGLRNSGNTGANAAIVNSGATLATLTVDQDVNTTYGGRISGAVALVKEGSGVLVLGYVNTYTGATTVCEGTLKLGVNSALSLSSPVVLDGGTLDIGGATNTLSTLSVTAPSTLALGSGEVTFGNQSSTAWSGQLTLTGTLGATSLRFIPALNGSQLALIKYNGQSVMQSAAGYIQEIHGTIIVVR